MKRLKQGLYLALMAAGVLVASAVHTAAYLDPSIVTYIISVASGVLVAGGAGIAIYWKRIKLFLKKHTGGKGGQQSAAKGGEGIPVSHYEYLAD